MRLEMVIGMQNEILHGEVELSFQMSRGRDDCVVKSETLANLSLLFC